MIRLLQNKDIRTVCSIVNKNWKTVYADYLNPELLNTIGCKNRELDLRKDFETHKFSEYVWEEYGQVLALLSIGNTADNDKPGAFEMWRIYIGTQAQGNGIGGELLSFAEQKAKEDGCSEIVIWAFKQNTRTLKFYRKHGYIPDKTEYLGEPYLTDGVRLVKKIWTENNSLN